MTHDDHDCASCRRAPGVYLRKMGRLDRADCLPEERTR